MRKGTAANFIIYEAPGLGMPMKISLNGFSAAYRGARQALRRLIARMISLTRKAGDQPQKRGAPILESRSRAADDGELFVEQRLHRRPSGTTAGSNRQASMNRKASACAR